jgi:hypothetical protein
VRVEAARGIPFGRAITRASTNRAKDHVDRVAVASMSDTSGRVAVPRS